MFQQQFLTQELNLSDINKNSAKQNFVDDENSKKETNIIDAIGLRPLLEPTGLNLKQKDIESNNKYKNIINSHTSFLSEQNNYQSIDKLLEREKQQNKTETWNKLDKTLKIQKLHQYAEKYGRDNALSIKEIKNLKTFFIQCMDKNKLQKTKEVIYDKDNKEIISIPSLFINPQNHNFTLKIIDSKRVSTLKSLTPKRSSERDIV
jgi:hypothetical protein